MDASVDAGLRTFMLGVYSKLTIGIAIAGVLAFVAGTVPVVRDLVFGTPLYYVVMFAPPALIIGSMFFMKNPSPTGSAIQPQASITLACVLRMTLIAVLDQNRPHFGFKEIVAIVRCRAGQQASVQNDEQQANPCDVSHGDSKATLRQDRNT